MTKKTTLSPLLEDDLARIDMARDVVDEMGALARSLCYKPYITRDQIARMVQWRETFSTAIHATERMVDLLQTMPELEGLIQKAALVTEIAGDLQQVIDECPGAVSDFPALQKIASKVARYAKP